MKRVVNKVKLFINDNKKSLKVAKDLKNDLNKFNFYINEDEYDLAISVGGDGSFLRMVKDCEFNDNIFYIGVNSGTLGFLQEINYEDMKDFVKRLDKNDFKVEKIGIQETKIITKDNQYVFNSLNEIVFRDSDFNTLKTSVYVDGEFLEKFHGDGLLISTSTGSTAYNMSFGGSIVYNTLNTLSITPIAPLNSKVYSTLSNSLVMPGNKVITFLPSKENNKLFIQVDGVNKVFDNVVKIETTIGKKVIKCIRMNDFHFIKVINSKIIG